MKLPFRKRPPQTQIRCADCGFIGMRHKATGELREAPGNSIDFDVLGVLHYFDETHPDFPDPATEPYERTPLCLYGIKDFRLPERGGTQVSYPDHSRVFERWNCGRFVKRIVGLSPDAHRQRAERDEAAKADRSVRLKLVVVAGVFTVLGAVIAAAATLFA